MAFSDEEMSRAIACLRDGRTLARLEHVEVRRLRTELDERFSGAPGRWMWERLRLASVSRRFDDDRAYVRLAAMVPELAQALLFFPGSDDQVVRAYRGTIEAIADVIAECTAFEYVVAPPDLTWLICENHHGVVIAVGEPIMARLQAL